MENREHFEARAAFEHAVDANNQVAKLVRLKYQHELALQRMHEKAMFWQMVSIMALIGFIVALITQL